MKTKAEILYDKIIAHEDQKRFSPELKALIFEYVEARQQESHPKP